MLEAALGDFVDVRMEGKRGFGDIDDSQIRFPFRVYATTVAIETKGRTDQLMLG